MEEQIVPQARQTAYTVTIKDLLKGTFFKEEGWSPNYVKISDKHVSRINIIGTIISEKKENTVQHITIDDGTDRINLRNFEKSYAVSVGDIMLVVGRVRQYGPELYITPEIMKPVDARWSAVWKKRAVKGEDVEEEEVAEEEVKEVVEEKQTQRNDVLDKIRAFDDGSGVSYDELIRNGVDEKKIQHLLLQGEVFEIKPGRIKVLE
ncbi:MAG TPA: hypothetical protein VKE88_00955 [Candidatus Nanoarchaeia archaeon]|nr:hypothetical protein [Candidatus Nanoarchaeia archaeon]